MAEIAGFWSYVHLDDEAEEGAITRLADRLIAEFELISGEPLKLFTDREIGWGDEWKMRIDRELQETTFFIPILTPRYFQSDECRRELVTFKSAAERFQVQQLLLPIYYVTVPEMEEEEPEDELLALVSSFQREDMRDVRLAEERDSTFRGLVNRLAMRLLTASRETEGMAPPPAGPRFQTDGSDLEAFKREPVGAERTRDLLVTDEDLEGTADPSGSVEASNWDEEGELEVLAAGEKALVDWVGTVTELNAEIDAVSERVNYASPKMAAATSFAEQLKVTRDLALALDEPATNITKIAQDYSTHLITVDPAIQTLIEQARTDESVREAEDRKEFFSAVLTMTGQARGAAAGFMEMIDGMKVAARASRELRQRLRKIEVALRNVVDGQEILDDWEAQIDELYDGALTPAESAAE